MNHLRRRHWPEDDKTLGGSFEELCYAVLGCANVCKHEFDRNIPESFKMTTKRLLVRAFWFFTSLVQLVLTGVLRCTDVF